MLFTKIKRAVVLTLGLTLLIGTASLAGYHTLAGSRLSDGTATPVGLPEDPWAVVVMWDYRQPGVQRNTDKPQLQVRAEGTVVACDPTGKQVEERLSPPQLQKLLRFAIHEQGFFHLDGARIQSEILAEQRRRGLLPKSAGPPLTIVRLCADGQTKELRCPDLRCFGDNSPETKPLAAIEQRLERLRSWAYAGGNMGVAAALRSANDELRRQFPEAPLLEGSDLQAAVPNAEGGLEMTFERRGVGGEQEPFTFIYARLERSARGEFKVTVKADLAQARADAKGAKELNLRTAGDRQRSFRQV